MNYIYVILLVFLLNAPVYAQSFEGAVIGSVQIQAAEDIDIIGVQDEVKALKGKRFSEKRVNALIKKLYLAGKFHNIYVYTDPMGNGGVRLRFVFEQIKQLTHIQFKGNSIFSDLTLRRNISSREGESFSESRLLNDKLIIQKLYTDEGYVNALVQLHFFSPEESHLMKVTFEITEREPTRITAVILDSEGTPKSKQLRPIISLKEGSIFNASQLKQEIRKLKDYFVEKRFLEASIEPEKLSYTKDKSGVTIYIKVKPGPRYIFSMSGNKAFTQYDLLKPLRERPETTHEVSIDDIIKYILSTYKTAGYFHIQVFKKAEFNSNTNERTISLSIREGKPVTIRKFHIEGNRRFGTDFYTDLIKKHGARSIQKGIYNSSDLQELTKIIINALKSRGFLLADASLGSLNWNAKHSSIAPEITVKEGPQTTLRKIVIKGNQHFTKKEILEQLDLIIPAPLNLLELDRHLKRLIDFYKENGFLTINIHGIRTGRVIEYSSNYESATLQLRLMEGPQVKIGNILFRGAIRTRNRVMKRTLNLTPGDIWNPREIRRSEAQLLRLGLFSSTKISPSSGQFVAGKNDLLVEVTERLPGLMEFGGGFASDDGIRTFAGFAYRNLGGWHRVFSVRAEINRPIQNFKFLERNIKVGFSEPYLFGIPFRFRMNGSHVKEETLPVDKRSWKGEVSLDKWFWNFLHLDLRYAYEFRHIFRAIDANDLQKTQAASMGPTLQFDFRNDSFNPTTGSFHSLTSKVYLPEIGSSDKVDLMRHVFTSTWYFTPWSPLTFAFLGRAGFARSFSDDEPIPVDLRYYLGGRSTIRGFKEDIIGSDTKNNKIFENSFVNYRAEMRFKIYKGLGLALFADGGNVFFDDINKATAVSKFRHSFGPGIRYQTPIGPLSLDFGFIVSRDSTKNEPLGRFHFSIGHF